jgi:TfoX/Sxy family transcriptional regulator of competence genes
VQCDRAIQVNQPPSLLDRVRDIFDDIPNVDERKMFGGTAFMLNDKMCVTVRDSRIMVRVDPELNDELTSKKGAATMVMNGRTYRGYIRVDADVLATDKALREWVDLALDFNARAKRSARKRR